MRGERDDRQISIYLTSAEVFQVQAGRSVIERLGVTSPDAKVEVFPLSTLEDDNSLKKPVPWRPDRLERARIAQLKGQLFRNEDLNVFIPAISLIDVRLGQLKLPREQIASIPMDADDSMEYRNHVIPEEGVTIHLGGSRIVVDMTDAYYSDNDEEKDNAHG